MFESFYQLTTNPFRLAPDPNFCFSHSGYKRAMDHLEYVLNQGEGFVLMTGRPGTGKTLLLETFLKKIDTSNVVARRIAVSNYAGDDLLRAVAYAYDIDAEELDKATLCHRIHLYFIEQEQAGRRVLLIIDEAQALKHAALEELRILADLQTPSRLMLQLFLVGQESLQDLMRSPDMEQFQQRVIANYHLVPLSLVETRAYIEYRLLHAGWNGDPEFTSASVLAIYQISNGVPRHVNKICNRLLLLGSGNGCHIFDGEDVQTISDEMREEQLMPMGSNRARSTDAESITSIPEIRDGLLSIDDLAIRADKVDTDAAAISETFRLASMGKEQFIDLRYEDPSTCNVPHSSSADPVKEPVAERNFSQFSRRETLVATVVILAVTTISIIALPSLFGETAGKGRLSRPDVQIQEIQDMVGTGFPGLFDDELISDEVVVAVTTEHVEFQASASDAGADEVVEPIESNDETIEKLLSQGQRSLDDFRLLTPEDDSAYGYFRAALRLDPANIDASDGIQKIVDRYIMLGRKAADQHENIRAKRYVKRGLSIQPANRELLALQDSIDRNIQAASIAATPEAYSVPESHGATSTREQSAQGGLIQGIRSFFNRRQADARSGKVDIPAGWDD